MSRTASGIDNIVTKIPAPAKRKYNLILCKECEKKGIEPAMLRSNIYFKHMWKYHREQMLEIQRKAAQAAQVSKEIRVDKKAETESTKFRVLTLTKEDIEKAAEQLLKDREEVRTSQLKINDLQTENRWLKENKFYESGKVAGLELALSMIIKAPYED